MSADVSGITFRAYPGYRIDSRIIRTMTRDDGFHAARRSRSRFERDESEMRHRHPRTAPRTHGMTMRAIRDARGRATAGRWQQSPVRSTAAVSETRRTPYPGGHTAPIRASSRGAGPRRRTLLVRLRRTRHSTHARYDMCVSSMDSRYESAIRA